MATPGCRSAAGASACDAYMGRQGQGAEVHCAVGTDAGVPALLVRACRRDRPGCWHAAAPRCPTAGLGSWHQALPAAPGRGAGARGCRLRCRLRELTAGRGPPFVDAGGRAAHLAGQRSAAWPGMVGAAHARCRPVTSTTRPWGYAAAHVLGLVDGEIDAETGAAGAATQAGDGCSWA